MKYVNNRVFLGFFLVTSLLYFGNNVIVKAQTIIVCPGTGVKCNFTAPKGEIISQKDKDAAAVVVK